MTRLLIYDLRLQWRQGFWLVYGIVSIVYLLILFSLPASARETTALIFVITDTTVLGIMFVAALVLLEKQQNVLQSIFVTPLRLRSYLFSKTVSLGLLSLVMSMAIYIPVAGFSTGTLMLIMLIIPTSALFILLGIAVAAGVQTLNQYLGAIIILSVVIMTPLAPFLLFDQTGWMRVFPSNALYELALLIDAGSFNRIALTDIAVLFAWLLISWLYAGSRFKKLVLKR